MRKGEKSENGVRVLWHLVWPETYRAMDVEALKKGAVVGSLVPVRVASRPSVGRSFGASSRSRAL